MALKDKLIRTFTTTKMTVKQHSPEILLGAGVASIVVGTVCACRATLKMEQILEERAEEKDNIENFEDEAYSEEDRANDLKIVKYKTVWDIIKTYSVPAGLIGVGITAIACSYGIMKKRYLAVSAAYEGVKFLFDSYRERVRNDVGEEKDKEYLYGTYKIKDANVIVGEDEEGNDIIEVKDAVGANIFGDGYSAYAAFFDAASPKWMKDPEYNFKFLRDMQCLWNDRLHTRGVVLLNEVLASLGIRRTAAGARVGWYDGPDSEGDHSIDFGIFDAVNDSSRNMAYGYEPVYLLDFNVDGIVSDKFDNAFVWSKRPVTTTIIE